MVLAQSMLLYAGKEPIVKAEYGGGTALIASDGQLGEGEAINAMASSVHMAADTSYSVKVATDCHSHLVGFYFIQPLLIFPSDLTAVDPQNWLRQFCFFFPPPRC